MTTTLKKTDWEVEVRVPKVPSLVVVDDNKKSMDKANARVRHFVSQLASLVAALGDRASHSEARGLCHLCSM